MPQYNAQENNYERNLLGVTSNPEELRKIREASPIFTAFGLRVGGTPLDDELREKAIRAGFDVDNIQKPDWFSLGSNYEEQEKAIKSGAFKARAEQAGRQENYRREGYLKDQERQDFRDALRYQTDSQKELVGQKLAFDKDSQMRQMALQIATDGTAFRYRGSV
jgi:hypothetical protein